VSAHDRSSAFRPAWWLGAALIAAVALAANVVAQSKRDVSVTARKYSFTVSDSNSAEIRVQQDDIVNVTFTAADIPHGFTITDYRIDKRAEPGQPIKFSFRADRAGEFEIHCNLTIDERCQRDMHAKLIVVGK
jgi:heme/copper-type cytochrome/quinol oxidase subunit 2